MLLCMTTAVARQSSVTRTIASAKASEGAPASSTKRCTLLATFAASRGALKVSWTKALAASAPAQAQIRVKLDGFGHHFHVMQ